MTLFRPPQIIFREIQCWYHVSLVYSIYCVYVYVKVIRLHKKEAEKAGLFSYRLCKFALGTMVRLWSTDSFVDFSFNCFPFENLKILTIYIVYTKQTLLLHLLVNCPWRFDCFELMNKITWKAVAYPDQWFPNQWKLVVIRQLWAKDLEKAHL